MKHLIRLRWVMIALSTIITIAFIATSVGVSGEDSGKEPASPKIIAVKFHADWCGFCKEMGTVFTDLRNKYDGKPVLFITLDFTNRTTHHQAELLASAIGMGEAYKANQGTGFILLLDGQQQKVLARLTSKQTLKEMGTELDGLLAR